jgi:hypothetical protein
VAVVDLLVAALGMLPKHAITVEADIRAEYSGFNDGFGGDSRRELDVKDDCTVGRVNALEKATLENLPDLRRSPAGVEDPQHQNLSVQQGMDPEPRTGPQPGRNPPGEPSDGQQRRRQGPHRLDLFTIHTGTVAVPWKEPTNTTFR